MPHLVNIGRSKMINNCRQGNYERNNPESDCDEVVSPGDKCRCFPPKHRESAATPTRELLDMMAAVGGGSGFAPRRPRKAS